MRPEFGLPIYEIFDMKAGLPTYEILDMKACRITTLFWGRGEGRGGGRKVQGLGLFGYRGWGFAFAVQPHREVRPESGLVGIVEHIVVNKR